MKTQLELAREGNISSEMHDVAGNEGVEVGSLRKRIANGTVVIIGGNRHGTRPVGVGEGLISKVNASIGTSTDIVDLDLEIKKAKAAENSGADTLMELSVGGDLDLIRRKVIAATSLPVGTVPLYQAFREATDLYGDPNKLTEELLFEVIERQCADGIAFMAIHCGINLYTTERLNKQGYRYGGLVSKGGATMVGWMLANEKENPLYERFDKVVAILNKYDTVLSLGNGLRAGAIADSLDRAQIQELIINCELAEAARDMGCQVMVEGPGHVPLDEIEASIILEKKMSGGAPYYMLGPLVTDIGAGYDHITAAIGIASSSRYGADLLCYITPAEHLALPNIEDVIVGVKAAKVAAHAGDIVKLRGRTDKRDLDMSLARRDINWEKQFSLALYGDDARSIRDSRTPESEHSCTMCGKFCALKNANRYFL
ncbi:MAG TPA: phosphomethylpyrimidine synthase ThiC [Anaerolineae bacterium]|jgi:phosphomethylpyrimidine synthase|nr:phosphomethylpyrimidine synthase ThiC [Anaerolineae bacterium]